MICVLPCCPADVADMLRLLKWIALLGPCKNHDALIVTDASVPALKALELKALADGIFKEVRMTTNEKPVVGWPNGANSLFHAAAKFVFQNSKEPWLWLEPDAIPLKHGWLDSIDESHTLSERGKMPPKRLYMGHIYANSDPRFPKQLMSGVAVYPWDAYVDFEDRILKSPMAWDVDLANVMVSNGVHTPLIHHIWGEHNNPPVFSETGVLGTSVFCLEQIPKETVIWHRNKDHSLIRLTAKQLDLEWSYQPREPRTFVQLGRYGDLILLLPAMKHIFDMEGSPPRIIVSQEFASVLEGVSYVQSVPVPFGWHEVLRASKFAEVNFGKHTVIQSHGANWHAPDPFPCPNYQSCMHIRTGVPLALMERLPLVFDQRDLQRESEIRIPVPNKPFLLLNWSGVTSPFHCGEAIKSMLRHLQGKMFIWDISTLRLRRIYDLIGLMDKAIGTITIDTATLHLAHASVKPYIALTADGGSSSVPRGNVELNVKYNNFNEHIPEMVKCVERWLSNA